MTRLHEPIGQVPQRSTDHRADEHQHRRHDCLVDQSEADIRRCLDAGAATVQLDFTEGRLSLKLGPSCGLLQTFVDLNNQVLDRFSAEERQRIGLHTCPGGDQNSTHSLDIDYAELLPDLFQTHAGKLYLQLASEPDRRQVLEVIREQAPADATIFIGVIDPIDPRVESAEEVRDRVLEAAEFIPVERLGTCDDCGRRPASRVGAAHRVRGHQGPDPVLPRGRPRQPPPGHRRQLGHPGLVRLPPLDRAAAEPAVLTLVRTAQPLSELSVEVGR